MYIKYHGIRLKSNIFYLYDIVVGAKEGLEIQDGRFGVIH